MARILEVKEKGPESATIEDIPLVYEVTSQFLNVNPEAQKLVGDLEMKIVINIEGVGPYHMTVKQGKLEYGEGGIDNPDFTFSADLVTISKLLLGQLDPTVGFFSEEFKAEGELSHMILYLELLDLAGEKLGITTKEEKKSFLEINDMKKLLSVYEDGASTVDPSTIPLFFEILTAYVNLNPEAQEFVVDDDNIFLMKIREVGEYIIQIEDGKMRWSEGTADNYTLRMEMDMQTSADVVIAGDAVTAYMAGSISVEGNIANGLFFQELIQMFLEFLDLS